MNLGELKAAINEAGASWSDDDLVMVLPEADPPQTLKSVFRELHEDTAAATIWIRTEDI